MQTDSFSDRINKVENDIRRQLEAVPNHTVDWNNSMVDGIYVPLVISKWGNTDYIRFKLGQYQCHARDSGGFDIVRIVAEILKYVQKEKEKQAKTEAQLKKTKTAAELLRSLGVGVEYCESTMESDLKNGFCARILPDGTITITFGFRPEQQDKLKPFIEKVRLLIMKP